MLASLRKIKVLESFKKVASWRFTCYDFVDGGPITRHFHLGKSLITRISSQAYSS